MSEKTLWQMKVQLARAMIANAIISVDLQLLKFLGWCCHVVQRVGECLTNRIYPEGAAYWDADTAPDSLR